ncbi:hypothetical protein CIB48_g5199 [Xylaria polymorpha]|nr:hypothetical protein CIB48_g5199 [Xylaria polymorpha]
MSLPEPGAIVSALMAYRTYVGNRTHQAFSAIIPEIVAAIPDDPDLFESAEELEEARLDFTLQLVGDSHPLIVSPSDILMHWDDLAPQLGLDGTMVHHDPERRERMRAAYTRGVVRGLTERCPGVEWEWEFPADLAIVLQHVDALVGPGWYQYRERRGIAIFLEGWIGVDGEEEEVIENRIAARVKQPRRTYVYAIRSTAAIAWQ